MPIEPAPPDCRSALTRRTLEEAKSHPLRQLGRAESLLKPADAHPERLVRDARSQPAPLARNVARPARASLPVLSMIVQDVMRVCSFQFRIFRKALVQDPYALAVGNKNQPASVIPAHCRDSREFAADLRMLGI